ncbi:SLOG family protein [Candidatus Allofournierella merdipullorum]|uniref:SLOG family protein n=1 Tax=Candidatus Allofournierella merdipullorum TaxID=2838595 RepID=UPI002A8F0385|nr:SLOG family protein [Candidatus Fournierella merdipullorum]
MKENFKEKTCCFTGHRVIPTRALPRLVEELKQTLRRLIGEGVRYFGVGGALGFDTLAAETVLRLKGEYPSVRLILVLPCRDQTRGWKAADARRYRDILSRADKVVYTAERYSPGCMHRRNRHLVENSSVCVAYCTRETGGSAYTAEYARQRGLRLVLLGAGE